MRERMQIGEVAERTGLSLRTIRYYEEVGLVTPTARSHGGFRLYAESDVARLELIMMMKPLGFHLDEMRDLLTALDPDPDAARSADAEQARLARLAEFRDISERRCAELRARLERAESFADMLRERLARQPIRPPARVENRPPAPSNL